MTTIDETTIRWVGDTKMRFAFVTLNGSTYTLRQESGMGIDIYIDIEGDDCHIAWQPVTSAAIDFIKFHANA